jgi:hypothetical protein
VTQAGGQGTGGPDARVQQGPRFHEPGLAECAGLLDGLPTVRMPTAELGGEGGLVCATLMPGLNPCYPHASGSWDREGSRTVTTGYSSVFCRRFLALTVRLNNTVLLYRGKRVYKRRSG